MGNTMYDIDKVDDVWILTTRGGVRVVEYSAEGMLKLLDRLAWILRPQQDR
jgi:hypothetical protein